MSGFEGLDLAAFADDGLQVAHLMTSEGLVIDLNRAE